VSPSRSLPLYLDSFFRFTTERIERSYAVRSCIWPAVWISDLSARNFRTSESALCLSPVPEKLLVPRRINRISSVCTRASPRPPFPPRLAEIVSVLARRIVLRGIRRDWRDYRPICTRKQTTGSSRSRKRGKGRRCINDIHPCLISVDDSARGRRGD